MNTKMVLDRGHDSVGTKPLLCTKKVCLSIEFPVLSTSELHVECSILQLFANNQVVPDGHMSIHSMELWTQHMHIIAIEALWAPNL